MTKPLTETEREMVRLAEEAARAGMVRRLPVVRPEGTEPVKKRGRWGDGRKGKPRGHTGRWSNGRNVLVTVVPKE